MLRLDDDFFWQSFDKEYFQFTAEANCPSAPATGADTFERKISLNPGHCRRLTQLHKLTPKTEILPRRESPLFLACRGKINCDKKSWRREPDPQKPNSL
jgi:hypothetical protein